MSVSHRVNLRVIAPLAAALAVVGALAFVAAAGAAKVGNTYLALGDSLAYGYHAAQFAEEFPNVDPASFDEGYVDDFNHVVKLFNPRETLINDGCPGEGTETMIHGSPAAGFCGGEDASPFPYVFLHHPYSTRTQLEDALKILHENPNVSPITLDIGANDLLHFIATTCGFPAADTCTEEQFGGEIIHIATNVGFILRQLRAAAPHAQIVLVGLYNPFPAFPAEGSDKITTGLNHAFEAVAAGVPGTSFANPEPLFNPSTVLGTPETTDLPTICTFTAMCPGGKFSPSGDIHPTKLGYQVMAGVVSFQFLTH
jgi:lysophospholipase L1-like esterase